MASNSENLKWVTLSDFSPGIQQRVNFQGSTVAPAKMGAATINTWRCIALPNGGLGPLPKRANDFTIDIPANSQPVSDPEVSIGAFLTAAPVLGTPTGGVDAAEVHIALTCMDSTEAPNSLTFKWWRIKMFDASTGVTEIRLIHSDVDTTGETGGPGLGSAISSLHHYRANASDPLSPGIPGVVCAWSDDTNTNAFWQIFPNPSSAGSDGVHTIADDGRRYEYVIGHQGRSVATERIGYDHGATSSWSSNEQIWYTASNDPDKDSSVTLPAVIGDEIATGYTALASLNASELILFKQNGGAFLLRGDIADPTVIRLPGVVSPGANMHVEPVSTPIGLIYISKNAGAWLWNGGETSQHISPQLEGDFYQIPDTSPSVGKLAHYKEWTLLPNNFLFDFRTNSWWRIEDPEEVEIAYWDIYSTAGFLYGCRLGATVSDNRVFSVWNANNPASSYQWESQPIPETMFRQMTLREVILVAQGAGTITLTYTCYDGQSNVGNTKSLQFELNSSNLPQAIRKNIALSGTHYQLKIEADNGDEPAPVIYEVRQGFKEAQHVPVQA